MNYLFLELISSLNWAFKQTLVLVSILDTSQQTFVGLEDVLKTSSTRLQHNNFTPSKTSWRRLAKTFRRSLEDLLQDVFKTSWKTKKCYADDVLKTSWRHALKMSSKHVLKTSWRCLEDMSWRPLKNFMETNKIFTGDICTTLKRIQNALISDDWFGLKLA